MITTEPVDVTVFVVTVNVAEVVPEATVTLEGTVAMLVLLLLRVTAVPLDGAGPVRVTVPVEAVPPRTLVGESVSAERVGARMVKVAELLPPAVMIANVLLETGVVVIAKVTLLEPAGTVTLEETFATVELLEERVTETPPVGASPFSVTVPVDEVPPVTELGERVTD